MPFFISKKKLQAMADGRRDILNININDVISQSTSKEIRKNQYRTYESQVLEIFDKYICDSDYGVSLLPAIIDIRTSLIAGEGISIYAGKKKTRNWIKKFIDYNKLNSINLIETIKNCEMEGRTLWLINKVNNNIEIKIVSNQITGYTIKTFDNDLTQIENIKVKTLTGETVIKPSNFVFIKYGGKINDFVNTTPKIAAVLTQIDNYERALYDLRNANHLFGFPTPCFETPTSADAVAINNQIKAMNWKIGQAFAGTGKMYFPIPPNSFETLRQEMSLNLKLVSSRTGVPVHWLGWTDLMSNRATADELREFINTGVKYEKMILKESIKELIKKAMTIAYDNGIEDAIYDPEGFDIDIPETTLEHIKGLSETWLPLAESGIISYADVRNKIPGIDPIETLKRIEEENEATESKHSREMIEEVDEVPEEEEIEEEPKKEELKIKGVKK